MQSGHGVGGAGSGGFSLAPSSPIYTPGQPLTITLNGVQPFRGLLLYAFDAQGVHRGSFQTPSGYQPLPSCGGDNSSTLGQTSSVTKPVPSAFTWTAPASGHGTLTFAALVVVSFSSWYVMNPITVSEAPSDVTPAPRASALLAMNASPNPFTESTSISYSLDRDAAVGITIHDVDGRVVRSFAEMRTAAGPHAVQWNGRDEQGEELGAGVYFVRVDAGGDTAVRKVLRVARPQVGR